RESGIADQGRWTCRRGVDLAKAVAIGLASLSQVPRDLAYERQHQRGRAQGGPASRRSRQQQDGEGELEDREDRSNRRNQPLRYAKLFHRMARSVRVEELANRCDPQYG